MPAATCPKCKTRVNIVPGEQPVCSGCGAKFKVAAAKPEAAMAATAGVDTGAPWPVLPESLPEENELQPAPFAINTTPARPIFTAASFAPQPPTATTTVATAAPIPPQNQPPVNAYAAPIAINTTWQPRFEPRKYPAMRIIIVVLYVFAGLVACSFLLSSAMLILGMAADTNKSLSNSPGMAAFGALAGVVMLFFSLVMHGFLAVMFMASAESIRVWLDIQQNTQEAAFIARTRP